MPDDPSSPYPPQKPSDPPVPPTPPPAKPRPAGNVPFLGQAAIGFALALIVIVAAGYLAAYANSNPTTSPLGSIIVIATPAALIVLSILAWIFWRWRGLLAGVLSAFAALVLLAVGAVLLLLAMCGIAMRAK